MANHNCNSCFLNASIMDAFSNMRLSKELNSNAPLESAQATVLNRELRKAHITRRVSSAWEYAVTFRLEGGEEKQLITSEEQYAQLSQGRTAAITWQGNKLVSLE